MLAFCCIPVTSQSFTLQVFGVFFFAPFYITYKVLTLSLRLQALGSV